jgi:hypothetical protein
MVTRLCFDGCHGEAVELIAQGLAIVGIVGIFIGLVLICLSPFINDWLE